MRKIKFLKRRSNGKVNIWMWKVGYKYQVGHEHCPFDSGYGHPFHIRDTEEDASKTLESYFEGGGVINGQET